MKCAKWVKFIPFSNWILEFEIYLGIGACNLGFNLLGLEIWQYITC
jgi:hypothetical protein